MSKYAVHNWYTLEFDAGKVAEIIPEDYEYKNGKVWGGSDLSQAIEWMRKYNEHDRTLYRVNVSVEAVDVGGVSAPQPMTSVKPWHESYGDDKVHMPKRETDSVEVGNGYTDGERTRMIALRVAKDVGAIFSPDAATSVAELFDQHEAAFDTAKMPDRTEEAPQWWRWVFNTDTGYKEWVPSGLDHDTPEFKRMSTGVSVVRVWGTTEDRDEKRDAILEADRKAGKPMTNHDFRPDADALRAELAKPIREEPMSTEQDAVAVARVEKAMQYARLPDDEVGGGAGSLYRMWAAAAIREYNAVLRERSRDADVVESVAKEVHEGKWDTDPDDPDGKWQAEVLHAEKYANDPDYSNQYVERVRKDAQVATTAALDILIGKEPSE